jgi:hypothetical protein
MYTVLVSFAEIHRDFDVMAITRVQFPHCFDDSPKVVFLTMEENPVLGSVQDWFKVSGGVSVLNDIHVHLMSVFFVKYRPNT